jgi:hypothetical protein
LAAFRTSILVFAAVVLTAGLWLLTIDLIRPDAVGSKLTPEAAATRLRNAHAAASLGMFRGDLWSDYVLILPSLSSAPQIADAQTAAERAAGLAPINAPVWLRLAQAEFRQGRASLALASLKMSYYTGPNYTELMPARLRFATQSNIVNDSELQMLIDHEIRTMLTRPDLRALIGPAYHDALPAGRRLIDKTLIDADPAFLKSIQPDDFGAL